MKKVASLMVFIVLMLSSFSFGSDLSNIYGYRISDQSIFPICTAPGWQFDPIISDNVVVWRDYRRGDPLMTDIYGRNLITQTEFLVNSDDYYDYSITTDGHTVAWIDGYENIIKGKNIDTQETFVAQNGANPCVWGNDVYYQSAASGNHISKVDTTTGDISYVLNLGAEQANNLCTNGQYLIWNWENRIYVSDLVTTKSFSLQGEDEIGEPIFYFVDKLDVDQNKIICKLNVSVLGCITFDFDSGDFTNTILDQAPGVQAYYEVHISGDNIVGTFNNSSTGHLEVWGANISGLNNPSWFQVTSGFDGTEFSCDINGDIIVFDPPIVPEPSVLVLLSLAIPFLIRSYRS